MKLKNYIFWTIAGALFGVFFGLIASIFQGGPAPLQGINESWIFFAAVGFLKAFTDPKQSQTKNLDNSKQ